MRLNVTSYDFMQGHSIRSSSFRSRARCLTSNTTPGFVGEVLDYEDPEMAVLLTHKEFLQKKIFKQV